MNDDQDPDLELLLAWRAGDEASGNQLCKRFEPKLRRLFNTKAPRQDVDELMQQTWLAMTQLSRRTQTDSPAIGDAPGSGPLQIRTTFRAYLLGIARHVILGYHRKVYKSGVFDPEVDSVATLVPSLSRQLSLQRKIKQLDLALHCLPIDLQLLVEARYIVELTGPELAEMFGIPEGTVRSRLSRARRLIDEALERWEQHSQPANSGTKAEG